MRLVVRGGGLEVTLVLRRKAWHSIRAGRKLNDSHPINGSSWMDQSNQFNQTSLEVKS